MDTSKALKFVRGAVAGKNSLLTEMTHYAIEDGQVRAFNGVLSINSPIDFPFDCYPKADKFGLALTHCESDVMTLSLMDNGKLRVQGGRFRAFVDTLEGPMPHPKPSGTVYDIDGEKLLACMERLYPFIGTDASRPWSNGILFADYSAFATNNVILVQHWLGVDFPRVNVPAVAIKELRRIGEPPHRIQVDNHSLTFFFSEDRWLHTLLLATDWPDVNAIFEGAFAEPSFTEVPEELFPGLETIKPFAEKNNWVFFRDGWIYTTKEDDTGASYEVPGLPDQGVYNLNMLSLLDGNCDQVDFGAYPDPVPFKDNILRGVILGLVV